MIGSAVSPPGLVATCCACLLSALGGDKVSFPGNAKYDASLSSYFSQQAAAVTPACIVAPAKPEDVAATLRTLTSEEAKDCAFAVRSGGHTMFPGAANIDKGVTIDLQGLNSIQVHPDSATVSVGPGATWDKVYATLEPLGRIVTGGRAAGVGVGGLSLGGGISFFSPRYGWTCDTVTAYQVVLANGTVVEASAQQHPALFKALRGGSNNFGVVTRVDVQTFEQGQMWGGIAYHPLAGHLDDHIDEFVKISSPADGNYDEYASLVTSFGYQAATGVAVANQMIYTKATPKIPAIYEKIVSLPTLYSTMRLTNMTDLATETGKFQAPNLRDLYRVSTVQSTRENVVAAWESMNASVPAIQGVAGIVWSVTLEPLPRAIYARHAAENSLGLEDRTAPLVVVLLTATWTQAADDEAVAKAADEVIARINQAAQKAGTWDPYVYLNYAGAAQDPIASYGEKSVEHLRRVRDEVDPDWVFTKRVPGAFKIPARK